MNPAAPCASGTVTILLSARNGAAYLPEQLDSLLAQRDVAWTLLWRDDGSTDATVSILRDFAARVPATELPGSGPLGIASSFWTLLQAVPPGPIAFCDQDDVWFADKLTRGLSALAAVSANVPTLYCARQTLVDNRLRRLGASPALRRIPVFPLPLAQNIATGCTILLNDAAVRLLRRAPPPPSGTLHDWWCVLLVTAAGGRVIADAAEVMLYRQHPANAVGAPATLPARALGAMRRGRRPFMAGLRLQVAALCALAPMLDPGAVRQLDAIAAALAQGPAARLRVLWRTRLRRQGWLESLAFAAWFVWG